MVWAADQVAPWVLLTDLPPDAIGVCGSGLRVWIELGFRALKGVGWQGQHPRRTDPARVARHWLVTEPWPQAPPYLQLTDHVPP